MLRLPNRVVRSWPEREQVVPGERIVRTSTPAFQLAGGKDEVAQRRKHLEDAWRCTNASRFTHQMQRRLFTLIVVQIPAAEIP